MRELRDRARFTALRPPRKPFLWETIDILEEKEDLPGNEETEDSQRERKNDFGHMPGFAKLLQGGPIGCPQSEPFKEKQEIGPIANTFRSMEFDIFEKCDSGIKRGAE